MLVGGTLWRKVTEVMFTEPVWEKVPKEIQLDPEMTRKPAPDKRFRGFSIALETNHGCSLCASVCTSGFAPSLSK